MAEDSAPRKNGPGRPFRKGQSGNPGGMPKAAPEFRARSRSAAEKILAHIERRIANGGLSKMAVRDVINALQVLADRGGYVSADKEMNLLLRALESDKVSDEQRQRIIDAFCPSTSALTEAPSSPEAE